MPDRHEVETVIFIKARQIGITLVEALLVIVIGAGILLLSLRQYESFRIDANVLQLQGNVDTLLQSLAQYYYANCYGVTDVTQSPALKPGTLNPNHSPAPTDPFPIVIQDDLVAHGYLTSPFPFNPIVDNGKPATQFGGYVAQFNLATQPRLTCIAGTNATGTTPASGCTATEQTGVINIWKPQVAVAIQGGATEAAIYANLLSADCTSSLSNGTVLPCSKNQPGNYLVWERLPSTPASRGNTSLWESKNVTNDFNLMYSTYSTVYLTTEKGITSPQGQTQYFLCGG